MNLIITRDYEAMSRFTAAILLAECAADRRVNLCITTGNTPERAFELLGEHFAALGAFPNVHYYNFDEMPILNPAGQVVAYETLDRLTASFFRPCNIAASRIHHLNEHNYEWYDDILLQDGGLDLIMMGLGEDGHFCANMPETTHFPLGTHCVKLTDEYPWNRPYQDSLGENYCDDMITMGPRTVMGVRKLLLIVNGSKKAEILKRCLEGEVCESVPASLLRLHPALTVLCDRDAAALLDPALPATRL